MMLLPVLSAPLLPAPAAPALLRLPLPLSATLLLRHLVTIPPVLAHTDDPGHLPLLMLQICNLGSRGR